MRLEQLDQRYLMRGSSAGFQITRAEGNYIYDQHGRKYIDFTMGWCVGNLGWGRAEIRDQIGRGHHPEYVHPEFLYRPWVELARLLAELAPGELEKSYRATGGTEAVDIALQVAMVATGRGKFLSLEYSYHGNSIGALSIGASEDRRRYPNALPNCLKLEPPLDGNAVDRVEALLRNRDVAAFIMEPIPINLGVMVPAAEFMDGVSRLCRKFGTLFIADEVACGFGRTGRLFACEHFDLEPDILCLGKAITAGFAGMGATMITPRVARKVQDDLSFWSTYGWHPFAVDAAIANLRYIKRRRRPLLRNVERMSTYFQTRLSAMEFEQPAQISMKGLAIALQLGSERYASKIGDACREAGLVINAVDNYLAIFPALTIDRKTAEQGLDLLEACL